MFSRFGLKIMAEMVPGFPPVRGSVGSPSGSPAVHAIPPCPKRPPKIPLACSAKAKPVKKAEHPPTGTVRCKSPSPNKGFGDLIWGKLPQAHKVTTVSKTVIWVGLVNKECLHEECEAETRQ